MKGYTARFLYLALKTIGRVIPSILRRLDLSIMDNLMTTFLKDIKDAADEHVEQIDVHEAVIVGAFIITETYLPRSKERRFAVATMDGYHRRISDGWLTMLREDNPREFGSEAARHEFFDACDAEFRERYIEYRALFLDANGLWRKLDTVLFKSATRLVRSETNLCKDDHRMLCFSIGLVVVEHLARCSEAFE